MIEFRFGNQLDLAEVADLYHDSTLGERRPLDDFSILSQMIANANLVVTAWEGDLMVGIARTLTDFGYVGYLADLAVRESHQRRGIGIELIRRTRGKMGAQSMLVLLAAPAAVEYYRRIGFNRHESAWVLRRQEPLPGDPPDRT
jgi:predicted N-acetyltransferase YhbS